MIYDILSKRPQRQAILIRHGPLVNNQRTYLLTYSASTSRRTELWTVIGDLYQPISISVNYSRSSSLYVRVVSQSAQMLAIGLSHKAEQGQKDYGKIRGNYEGGVLTSPDSFTTSTV